MSRICLIALYIFCGCCAYSTAAEIRLMDSIAVHAPTITLGEIATIDGCDKATRDHLAAIELCDVPKGRAPRIVSAGQISDALRAAGLEDSCTVYGAQCQATLETRPVYDQEMLALIKGWVDTNVEKGAEAEIDSLKLPPTWKVPAGERVDLAVECRAPRAAGPLIVTLRAYVDGKVFSSTRARIHVSLYREALTVVKPLRRNEVITASHIALHRSDVTRATGMEVADKDQVVGLSARYDLPVGKLITAKDVEQPVLVKRGSLNRIIVENKGIQMSVAGAEALQDGRKGELVMFSNPMNQKEPLKARILDRGLALIELR